MYTPGMEICSCSMFRALSANATRSGFERHAVRTDAKQAVHAGMPAPVATAVQLQGKIARVLSVNTRARKRGISTARVRQLGALANRGVDAGLAGLVEIGTNVSVHVHRVHSRCRIA